MYEKIVDEDPYVTPMMIYPAVHYTMELGLIITYKLLFGCFSESNFSLMGPLDWGASALSRGL
jgi:succinate dehydrogenase / fumarate reductase flavoprotein subunit